MNRPTVHFSDDSLRKVGDSNPRYGNPHGSLANCWFQPLTQPSSRILNRINQASFLNASAKVLLFSDSTKSFCNFFSIKMHFLCNSHIIRGCFLSVWWVLSFLKRAEADFFLRNPPLVKERAARWCDETPNVINIWELSAFVIHRLYSLVDMSVYVARHRQEKSSRFHKCNLMSIPIEPTRPLYLCRIDIA